MRIRNTGLLFDDPAQSTPGYILICPVEGNRAILLEPNGEIAHQWQTTGGMTNWCYLLPNGNLFANERCENRKGVALTVSGRMSEYTPHGELVWRHEDPSETEGGPFGEAIRKVNDAGDTVWEWHFQELGLDSYPLHRNGNRWSYGHTNTVCPLADGTYLVSSKNLNLLFIIDPITNTVNWAYQNDEMGGQHDAQMLDNGNILVFANGLYAGDLSHSQVWEINPISRDIVWRYVAKDDMTSFYSPHMGGAQRLPTPALCQFWTVRADKLAVSITMVCR